MDYIGTRVKRVEDLRLLRAIGRFVGDIQLVGMVHAVILRSPLAHARIVSVNTDAAERAPGVLGVLTADRMPVLKTIPMRAGKVPGLERSQQYPIARDKVRYVGEPVGVIVAQNRYLAEDAMEFCQVKYEPLDTVTDPRAAMTSGAPKLHDTVSDNIGAHFAVDNGDVDSAMAGADLVLEDEFFTQRHGAVPLETRGLVAEFNRGSDTLRVWGPTKVTHVNRGILSGLLDLPESSIHFIEPDVGGGFGARGEFYPENFLIPHAAIYFRRPVCWIEDRSEHLKTSNQSREQRHRIKVGAALDGSIVAVEDEIVFNMGAYTRTHGAVPD